MNKGFLVVLALVSVSLFRISAQENNAFLKIEIYSVEDGLSQSSIQNIYQDRFGYLWVSTGDGLNCFDGRHFTRYYFNSLENTSNQSNSMRAVIGDSLGNLWIGTDRGLLYLNRVDDLIVQPFPEISDLINSPCLPLFCSSDSVSVLVVNKGILNIHIAKHRFNRILFHKQLADLSVFGSSNTEKWFWFYPSSLICISKSPASGIRIKDYTHFFSASENIKSVVKLDDDKVLLATGRNIYLLPSDAENPEAANTLSPDILPEGLKISTMLEDAQGMIWLSTGNKGLTILNRDLRVQKQNICLTDANEKKWNPANITLLFNDCFGNIWFGSDGYGLGLYNSGSTSFGLVDKVPLPGEVLTRPFVRCFLQDSSKRLWVGTYNNGLLCWDRRANQFSQILPEAESAFPSANDLYCLAPYKAGKLLAGTAKGLWIIDTQNKLSFPAGIIPGSASVHRVTDLIEFDSGNFEILMNQIPYRIEANSNQLSLSSSVLPDTIRYDKLFKCVDGSLLAFFDSGFYRVVNKSILRQNYTYIDKLVKLKVNAVSEDERGNLWLATKNGLIKMESSGKIIEFFGDAAGFSNHYMYGILSDNDSRLWLSHNRGLSEFNMASRQVINYQTMQGLQSPEFNSGAYYRSPEGEMFFGGVSGFNYFYPDKINAVRMEHRFFVSVLLINENPFPSDSSLMVKKYLDLAYSQNTVSFRISGINFGHADNAGYAYMLEGLDRKWILADDPKLVRYSQLKPGKYTFKLIAGNQLENPAVKPMILHLNIQKPFWMKTSFLIASLILSVGLIIFTVRYFTVLKMKKQIARLEQQREISLIHSRIASDLHDDVGSGLSRLAMMSDKVLMKSNMDTDIKQSLAKISSEARQMIDQLRVVVWALNPLEDKLDGFVAYLHRQMSDYLEDFPIKYSISIPDEIPAFGVSSEFKRNVYYAIREAVHNTVKHADARELSIEIHLEENTMSINVEDDGSGFDIQKCNSTGHGLQFIEKRIKDLGGMVTIMRRQSEGTTVVIKVPF